MLLASVFIRVYLTKGFNFVFVHVLFAPIVVHFSL
jgi:hypothetical protein